MLIKPFLIVVAGLCVTSCFDKQPTNSSLALTDDEYSKAKNLVNYDDKRKAALYKQFQVRSRISDAILSGELKDSHQLRVKLAEAQNSIVIAQYFEDYLDKKITKDVVNKYYDDNKAKFAANKQSKSNQLAQIKKQLQQQAKTKEYQRLIKLNSK